MVRKTLFSLKLYVASLYRIQNEKWQEKRIDYYLWEAADLKTGFSSMQRVTGFPATVATVLIGKRKIKERERET
jgi:hypothetical protein